MKESMMKWRVRKENYFSNSCYDDIRHSIEVLDNVLEEFDDCVDVECRDSCHEINSSLKFKRELDKLKLKCIASFVDFRYCFEKPTISDKASLNYANHRQKKAARIIPIKNKTPLVQPNENTNTRFTFHSNHKFLHDKNDILSVTEHVHRQIKPVSHKRNDVAFRDMHSELNKCINGDPVLIKKFNMETCSNDSESSPFHQKNLKLEDIETYNSYIERPPLKSTFMSNQTSNLVCSNKDSPFPNSVNSYGSLPNVSVILYDSSSYQYEEKLRRLNEKFKKVRELLLLNKIKPLDEDPPNFIPPPPPFSRSAQDSNICIGKDNSDPNYSSDSSSYASLKSSSITASSDRDELECSCGMCSASHSFCHSPTVKDIPNLLPTDVLVRPQLGLSYSLEEDMSPGVKEINQTSTPKSDVSCTSSFKIKDSSHLSTFNSSGSILGYVSSRSDLEINNLSDKSDKVPLTSYKSMTLPHGLDSFPFYSTQDNFLSRDNTEKQSSKTDSVDSPLTRNSSSRKPTRKEALFRVFSRKKKNG